MEMNIFNSMIVTEMEWVISDGEGGKDGIGIVVGRDNIIFAPIYECMQIVCMCFLLDALAYWHVAQNTMVRGRW